MGDQLPLPQLPPMKPPQSAQTQPPAAQAMPEQKGQATVSGRLRQLVGYVGGASLGFVLLVSVGQVVLRDDLKPTTLLATMEAQADLGIMNQKMGHAPGEHVLNEAQYQSIIAEAQRAGSAKAEFVFQQKIARLQADQNRVIGAYQTLYARANMIAQIAMQMESIAQQFRQQLLTMSNGGRSTVIMFKDIFCGLGDAQACESARSDRQVMISESDELSRGDAGARVRELMSGIDDPATLVAHDDERRNGVPALPSH